MAKYDAIVVGLGAMGGAALAELARRGTRVLGLEQFAIGHDKGSSHGGTRIIRLGYFEHPSYVPLLHRTYELWRELEARSGRKLMHITGIAEMGAPDSGVVSGTLLASKTHKLPHEVLSAAETMARFPAFRLPPHYIGVFQPDGGFLAVEEALDVNIALAKAEGADVRTGVAVRSVSETSNGVRITADSETFEADQIIVSAGAWAAKLFPELPLRVTREVIAWFEAGEPALFEPSRFPVFLLESPHGQHYGFPTFGQPGVKIAKHHHRNETVDPDAVNRVVSSSDEALIRPALADHIPAANGRLLAAKTCLYTVTPDHDFIIDRVPGASRVLVASPCSGHGFKFAPVMGEILADLTTKGATDHDISRFRLSRFG
jgi:sarcosine oxidase